ncbi:MAG: translocation protein TolB, partial [Bacteroidetes bacterium]|nr:translocation protein TolB [Bacteroidota bacterium]
MKRIAGIFLLALALCAPTAIATAQQNKAEQMYQQALYEMEGKGDYAKAIEIYKSVVGKYPANQPLAAKSLLRMGRCYEKLEKDEAKKAYERIIKEYASQADVVTEARARLAVLMDGTKLGGSPIARRLI